MRGYVPCARATSLMGTISYVYAIHAHTCLRARIQSKSVYVFTNILKYLNSHFNTFIESIFSE